MTESALQQNAEGTRPNRNLSVELRWQSRATAPFTLDVRFVASPGITVLFGASGSGKTTILDCIAGLRKPDCGRVAIGDRVLFDSGSRTDIPIAGRRVGYVLQNLALFPHMTASENIAYGLTHVNAAERTCRIEAISNSLGIAHVLGRRPVDISGGERQRVALARTLVTEPHVLLLDEPLSGIDLPAKSRIINDLRIWNDEHGIPIFYVTHDRSEVFALAENVIAIEQGKVIAQGGPLDVLDRPQYEAIAQLSGVENIFEATVEALHEDRGTMTCSIGPVQLEAPFASMQPGTKARLGIRAGDILLATVMPQGLSARNIITGRILSLSRRDAITVAQVDCGVIFEVHLTPHAQQSLGLTNDSHVWLVVKTHSCHLLRR